MVKEIQLTQGKVALVDDDDFDKLNKFKWYAQGTKNLWYACRRRRLSDGRSIVSGMHREIMNTPRGKVTDHIDGNGLNNQRSNLRICSHKDNIHNSRLIFSTNTSGYRGVTWDKQARKWKAQSSVDGKHVSIGFFPDAIQAAKGYDEFAKKHIGEFAKLNFPNETKEPL